MKTVTVAKKGARRQWRRVSGVYRGLTATRRALPDFVIIGASKCGTTTLYETLSDHPHVLPAAVKEVHFFDLRFHRGLDWYRAQFPLAARMGGDAPGERVYWTGEASPYYLFHPLAAARLKDTVPNARLIAMLRNPVERAYSQFQHELRAGRETLTFEEAIDREEERLAGQRDKLIANPQYHSFSHRRHSYASRGIYADQLAEWFALFDRRQLMVVCSEDFFSRPRETYDEIQRFIGVPIDPAPGIEKQNAGKYSPIARALRNRLVRFYAPHNQRLYTLLGRDLGWS